MPAAPCISLVIPVYNEEGNLPALAEEIRLAMSRYGKSWEAIFVDDGSSDGSLDAIRAVCAAPEFSYISLTANSGQSTALAAGFLEAGGEAIVTMDADLQNDPADIPAMLERYETGGYDMVIGWRAVRKDSWSKRWASRVGNMARNRLTRENVRDTGCSLKVLRASLARRLPMFAGMHRFLPTLMKMHGARVAEMPVNHRPRLHGVSKYGIWDRLRKTLFDLLAIRWMQSRHIAYSIRERKNS